jgi:hypothetical protein
VLDKEGIALPIDTEQANQEGDSRREAQSSSAKSQNIVPGRRTWLVGQAPSDKRKGIAEERRKGEQARSATAAAVAVNVVKLDDQDDGGHGGQEAQEWPVGRQEQGAEQDQAAHSQNNAPPDASGQKKRGVRSSGKPVGEDNSCRQTKHHDNRSERLRRGAAVAPLAWRDAPAENAPSRRPGSTRRQGAARTVGQTRQADPAQRSAIQFSLHGSELVLMPQEGAPQPAGARTCRDACQGRKKSPLPVPAGRLHPS